MIMNIKELEEAKSVVRNVPDFPVKGIQFKDLTTLFKDAKALRTVADALVEMYRDKGITKVVGIEARGFIGGAILATELGAGFVPLRKPGKLPHDDLLATGGTMLAAYELVKIMKPKKIYINFICGLKDLGGLEKFPADVEVTTLFDF